MQQAQLILDLSKAANAHLDLQGVLGALSQGLRPEIAFDALAVLVCEGDSTRLHALYLAETPPREGESLTAYVRRKRAAAGIADPEEFSLYTPRIETSLSVLKTAGDFYACEDLLAGTRFAEERRMISYGVRSYLILPLLKQGQLIGAIELLAYSPRKHSAEEIATLQAACEIISIAVANALAYEEIARLKDQLQNENQILQDEIDHRSMFEEIVGSSPPMRKLLDAVARVAPTDSTVLVTGETGTGKELIARAIHRRSPRASRTLVTVNCASLAPELVASEMFGHEKGAFTGALQRRIGRFESANRGTIFLDEIGELTPELQAALLRVLQERTFERVGGSDPIEVDVRIIAATNRNLEAEVNAGRFRMDLFYRLNVFPIEAPPLRDRSQDIPVLVDYFVARFATQMRKPIRTIARATLDGMLSYAWPGNVRELQNVLERAVILADDGVLRVPWLERPAGEPRHPPVLPVAAPPGDAPPPDPDPAGAERVHLLETLRRTRGRIAGEKGAAKLLGVPPSTLESRIRKLGIDKNQFRYES